MPLVYQSKIIEFDLLENVNVFYVYPENVDKEYLTTSFYQKYGNPILGTSNIVSLVFLK